MKSRDFCKTTCTWVKELRKMDVKAFSVFGKVYTEQSKHLSIKSVADLLKLVQACLAMVVVAVFILK